MSVWNERAAIPQKVVHAIESGNEKLGEELRDRREGKRGVVREVEALLVFDVATARKLAEWITTKIGEAEELAEMMKKARSFGGPGRMLRNRSTAATVAAANNVDGRN